jgi:adenosylmethionine-8-amino-7-oxononanoate aminotransferase
LPGLPRWKHTDCTACQPIPHYLWHVILVIGAGRIFANASLVVKGSGCELTSLDGDVLIDFLGEYTAGIYGHSNKDIEAAVSAAMSQGWNYGGPNTYERELARKVGLATGSIVINLSCRFDF